ncbi:ABC transporter permease [Patescibacteria group bacterium]|nr:ABC transporter permease [Patescibacteria group bacterium]
MLKLFIADLKLQFRNRQSLFWSIAFPLIFTVIFGFFFGSGSMGTGTVAVVNDSTSKMATSMVDAFDKQDAFKVQTATSVDAARDSMKKGKAAGALIIPAHFGDTTPGAPTNVTILYDPGSIQLRAGLDGFVNAYLTEANYRVLKVSPVFGYTDERANASASFTYFDYVLIGLIGMALMNAAIQGVAISMSKYRDDKILKRITTTPLPGWKFLTAEVVSRLIVNLVQITLILWVGIGGFHASIGGNLWALYGLSLVGAILFQLIGFSVAAVAKNTDAAEGMSQAIAIPMMFLAGVFFPIDQLPKWLYSIVQYLPLAPLLRAMRSLALESGAISDNISSLMLVGVWIVVLLLFAIYRFRLTDE